MKINKINVSYSSTIQWRQFEPITIYASAEAQVDPGETLPVVFKKVYAQLKKEVDDQAKVIKIQRKSNTEVDIPIESGEDY